jgi:hypothetical protein
MPDSRATCPHCNAPIIRIRPAEGTVGTCADVYDDSRLVALERVAEAARACVGTIGYTRRAADAHLVAALAALDNKEAK